MWGLRFWAQGLAFRVNGLGFRVKGSKAHELFHTGVLEECIGCRDWRGLGHKDLTLDLGAQLFLARFKAFRCREFRV